MKSNQKFKKKGMMLLSAVLAAFLLTMVASGYFMTLTGSFNAIKSGGEAIQAQRYAEIEANKLSLLAYNDLDSKVSQNVWKKSDADEGWEYKVNLGPEKVVDPSTNSKQRIATVSIRKEGDSTERFSMKVPLNPELMKKNKDDNSPLWGMEEHFYPRESNYLGKNFDYIVQNGQHYFIFKNNGLLIGFTGYNNYYQKKYCLKKNGSCFFSNGFGDVTIPIVSGDKVEIEGDLAEFNRMFGSEIWEIEGGVWAINRIVFFPTI